MFKFLRRYEFYLDSQKNAQKKRPFLERKRSPEPKTKIYETFYEQCKFSGWRTMDVHRYALQKYNFFFI